MDVQPSTTVIDPRAYAQMGLVGFGAVQQAILAQQVDLVIQQYDALESLSTTSPDEAAKAAIPLVEFSIYNDGPDAGFGQAYDLENFVKILNFPVRCTADEINTPADISHEEAKFAGMHLVDGQHDDLVNWLAEKRAEVGDRRATIAREVFDEYKTAGLSNIEIAAHDPSTFRDYMLTCGDDQQWKESSYLPRALYQEYLRDTFARTQDRIAELNHRLGFEAIKLNCPVDCTVTRIQCEDGSFKMMADVCVNSETREITKDVGFDKQFDAAIVATGHHPGPLFSEEVRQQPTFANTPLHDSEIPDAVNAACLDCHESVDVTIIGTGASYHDALRDLKVMKRSVEEQGKKLNITAISSKPLDFWPFDPDKSGQPYDVSNFMNTLRDLHCSGSLNDEVAKSLLRLEVHSAHAIDVGPQNLFANLNTRTDELEALGLGEDFMAFSYRLERNRTAPESYEIFREFLDEGSLSFVHARMQDASHDPETNRWSIQLNNGTVHDAGILVDCAGLATKVVGRNGQISDKLIARMVEDEIAVANSQEGIVEAAEICDGRLYFAGPAGNNGRGIPYTRHYFTQAAQPALANALDRAATRREAEGIEVPTFGIAA